MPFDNPKKTLKAVEALEARTEAGGAPVGIIVLETEGIMVAPVR